jgi:hypothetical protein
MGYPLDNAIYQWEEGHRRLRDLASDPRSGPSALRAVDAVRDEMRRRIGATFTAAELADLYAEGTDWCLEAARWALPMEAVDLDPQAIVDGAFYLHLPGAADYSGGRQVAENRR